MSLITFVFCVALRACDFSMLVWCDDHILISHWFFCDWFSGLTDVGYLSLGDHILLASTYSQLEGVLEPSGQMVQLGIKRVESDQSVIQQMKKEGSDSTCFRETDV